MKELVDELVKKAEADVGIFKNSNHKLKGCIA